MTKEEMLKEINEAIEEELKKAGEAHEAYLAAARNGEKRTAELEDHRHAVCFGKLRAFYKVRSMLEM